MTKCSVQDGLFVIPCESLKSNTDNPMPSFSKIKGIASWTLTNLTTGKPSRTYWGVKSKSRPNGFLFNFCPFCGERIDAPFNKEEGE